MKIRNKKEKNIRKMTAALAAAVAVASIPVSPAHTVYGNSTESTAVPAEKAGSGKTEPTDRNADMVIRTEEDLEALAKGCTLDSWSRGKIIVLAEDLDFTGREFPMIPIFGGTFYGNGHTISGVSVSGPVSSQGLFRYVEEGALIDGLTVSGNLSGTDSQEYLGGIAGTSSGIIRNCMFKGSVEGSLYTGGIVGINKEKGLIEACVSDGQIQGKQFTGGIAGENDGTIHSCKNAARINPNSGETSDIEGVLDTGNEKDAAKRAGNTIQNARTVGEVTQDTGGIAGFSKGAISDCTNSASVGYPHVGYNVGGIMGRSSGYAELCRNEGIVYGRKDVGGIAGQLSPEITRVFKEDTFDRLNTELDVLRDLADNATDHVDGNRSQISDRLDAISGYSRDMTDQASDLVDMTRDWADTNIEELNRLSSMADEIIYHMEEATADSDSLLDSIADGLDSLNDAAVSAGDGHEVGEDLQEAYRDLRSTVNKIREKAAVMKEAVRRLIRAVLSGDPEQTETEREQIRKTAEESLELIGVAREQVKALRDAAENVPELGDALGESLDALAAAFSTFEGAARDMEHSADEIHDMFDHLADQDSIQIEEFGSDFENKGDQLEKNMNSIQDQLDFLKDEVDSTGNTLSDDLDRMSDQLAVVRDVLKNAVDELRDTDRDEFWQDVSVTEIQNTTEGKIKDSVNRGGVEGDLNVGGITGDMDVESALDPEEDISDIGKDSLKFHYETRAVLEACMNSGNIVAKKEAAGGICGRMGLGYILECGNYGNVENTDGDYTGGIAGLSLSTIRRSYSKCTLSGKDYVGGIAGLAYDLYENTSFVTITDADRMTGAVAGYLDEDGIISRNRFVDTGLSGIDGISYGGKAEPMTYEELLAEETTPAGFRTFRIRYEADDNDVALVTAAYKSRIPDYPIPEVPEKKGYYGRWEMPENDTVFFDVTIEAEYTPYTTTIASETMRDSVRPVVLAEGVFEQDASVLAECIESEAGSEKWKISFNPGENPAGPSEDDTVSYIYRFIPPSEWNDISLTVDNGTEIRDVEFTRDGSACVFETADTEFILAAVSKIHAFPWKAIVFGAAVCGLGIIFILFQIRKKRKSRKKTKDEDEEPEGKAETNPETTE